MRAIIIPRDINQPMVEVEGENFREIAKTFTDIEWPTRVNTQKMHDHGMTMLLCDDGHDRKRELNLRAMLIAEYPGDTGLVGDAILVSEIMGPEGVTFGDAPKNGMTLINNWEIQRRGEGLHYKVRQVQARLNAHLN
jgi:hypothetical protein